MCWFFFVLASFASTVVALNMIIAIMSDTYSMVSESYVLYTKRMKLWILIDYLEIIQNSLYKSSDDMEKHPEFIVVVTKKSYETEQ